MIKNEFANVDALGTAKFLIHIGKKKEANAILDQIYPFCQTIAGGTNWKQVIFITPQPSMIYINM